MRHRLKSLLALLESDSVEQLIHRFLTVHHHRQRYNSLIIAKFNAGEGRLDCSCMPALNQNVELKMDVDIEDTNHPLVQVLRNRVKDGNIILNIDQMRFDVQWFLRDDGYLREASRGLAGIEEIKRLMPADTLTIEGRNNAEPHFTFNISQLTQVIKPLRNACHW